jgi:hypothetical protein
MPLICGSVAYGVYYSGGTLMMGYLYAMLFINYYYPTI